MCGPDRLRECLVLRAQVFGVTRDPFIIWTSNMFAIASLRALYGLVANVLAELRFLEKAIAIVLAWIGAKMIIEVRASRSPCYEGSCCNGLDEAAGW